MAAIACMPSQKAQVDLILFLNATVKQFLPHHCYLSADSDQN